MTSTNAAKQKRYRERKKAEGNAQAANGAEDQLEVVAEDCGPPPHLLKQLEAMRTAEGDGLEDRTSPYGAPSPFKIAEAVVMRQRGDVETLFVKLRRLRPLPVVGNQPEEWVEMPMAQQPWIPVAKMSHQQVGSHTFIRARKFHLALSADILAGLEKAVGRDHSDSALGGHKPRPDTTFVRVDDAVEGAAVPMKAGVTPIWLRYRGVWLGVTSVRPTPGSNPYPDRDPLRPGERLGHQPPL